MKEAIKALNVLYTYDKTYEPYLVLWLFPLQVGTLSENLLQVGTLSDNLLVSMIVMYHRFSSCFVGVRLMELGPHTLALVSLLVTRFVGRLHLERSWMVRDLSMCMSWLCISIYLIQGKATTEIVSHRASTFCRLSASFRDILPVCKLNSNVSS